MTDLSLQFIVFFKDSPDPLPSFSTRSLMFLKLSDLALLQMEAVAWPLCPVSGVSCVVPNFNESPDKILLLGQ